MRARSRFVLCCYPEQKLFVVLFLFSFSFLPKHDAFSSPPLILTSSNNRRCSNLVSHHHEYRLVDHVDQLQQPIRPPHLFSLPAPGGDICLVVDENGLYHAVRDRFPPLGKPVSESGIVDTEVCCRLKVEGVGNAGIDSLRIPQPKAVTGFVTCGLPDMCRYLG